ncbi:conserved hypothetical protein [Flavobacterium sp. 9AF]|uniref:hypothetical protein n=1 Tax=Flavobacterium sp. 9AF TaxID=2653142 RepID=UPI0012F3498A|nr:hypothetical protein [Flavobacterium sp. 9AF]VXB87724.1 conserved hypothetical protein [Flavobacterium sp. 9AF]
MKHYYYIVILIFITVTSCRNDFDFEPSVGNLEFSRDTVYLDTVFTNIGSSTYTLKVYNKSDKNISIPKIQLGKGLNSNYRLMVDGLPGKIFDNVELLANDSLFIFVEVTSDVADANPTDFLYTDQIRFGTDSNFQKVELVTLIQDAYFIYPERVQNPDNTYTYESVSLGVDENGNPVTIKASILSNNDPINGDELHWTNTKPYVVYGYAVVPNGETLLVDAGARIHFHSESGLIVADNASLQINGNLSTTEALENEVIFESDRLEPDFSEVPGQWGTIWFTLGSINNSLNHVTIKNATVGLFVTGNEGNSNLSLNNIQVYNCSNVGILARTGFITGKNIVTNNCGEASIACTFGGNYDFKQCTFANYWSSPSQYSLYLDDYNGATEYTLNAIFENCIIYGSTNKALAFEQEGVDTNFNYQFNNCLIRYNELNNPLYPFNSSKFSNCLIATSSLVNNPKFANPNGNELNIEEDAAVINQGINLSPNFNDIKGNPRPTGTNTNPDIGAYQFIN